MVEFLQQRRGFCEQFAATFAAMARSLGIPARVAVGYRTGTLGADDRYHVTNHDAHAWPEVWIDGAGWIPFEPTPGPPGDTFREPTLGIGTGGPEANTPADNDRRRRAASARPRPRRERLAPTVPPTVPGGSVSVQPAISKATHRSTLPKVFIGVAIAVASRCVGALGVARRASRCSRCCGAAVAGGETIPGARQRARRVGEGARSSPHGRRAPPAVGHRARVRAQRHAPAHGLRATQGPRSWSSRGCRAPRCSRREPPSIPARRTLRGSRSRPSDRDPPLRRVRHNDRSAATRRRRRHLSFRRSSSEPRTPARGRAEPRHRASGQAFHEGGAFGVERAHAGVHVGGDLVDRDEQRELARLQRVEDLAIVVARPHGSAVGDDAEARKIVTGFADPPQRRVHARRGQARVEQRAHDAQRDEITERVPAADCGRAATSPLRAQ